MRTKTKDPRILDVDEIKGRRIKPLISIRLLRMPEIDIIGELVEDSDNYFYATNLYLAIPVQNQGDNNISLGLRPWSMTASKDQEIIFDKKDILSYFEITNQILINNYINSTSDIKIASPNQMPSQRRDGGVIDLVRN